MKIRPAQSFFGCCSLLAGVELTCLAVLIINISIIAVCSSEEPLKVVHLDIAPSVQVAFASWAFVGIPVVIMAGVGAYYRIETNVRALFWYLFISFFLGLSVPISLLLMGSLCAAAIPGEVQRMGAAFVCGFADTFVFMWTVIVGAFELYLVYCVWSAAEDIAMTPYPQLVKYTDALRNVRIRPASQGGMNLRQPAAKTVGPVPAGPASFGRTTEPVPLWRPGMPNGSRPAPVSSEEFGPNPFSDVFDGETAVPGFMPAPPNNPSSNFGTRFVGQPQSFVPSPQSGADFGSRQL